ncbi:MAG TPA: DUF3277 family protein [Candidatus Aphodousia gallistercoris]|nr:DUF3277 family protein [Candidatus Aphodousia gallistercoris]
MSNTYSFQNVSATLTGTGVINFGYGAGNAKEGISVSYNEDINTMYVGADGEVMHSLKANKSGTVTIRLMRTSPINAQLQLMYNAQTLSSSLHGNNVITIRDKGNNEICVCRSCAFKKAADRNYSEDGQIQEWTFDAGKIDYTTGEY